MKPTGSNFSCKDLHSKKKSCTVYEFHNILLSLYSDFRSGSDVS